MLRRESSIVKFKELKAGAGAWLLGLLLSIGAQAQPAQPELTLGFSEGVATELTQSQLTMKYQSLADIISRSLGRRVRAVHVKGFDDLEKGLRARQFDFAVARPTDYMARGLRQYGYQYVASGSPDSRCLIITPKGSPIKSLKDIVGKRIVLPVRSAYMTRFCAAELRDQGIDLYKQNLQYVQEQSLIGMHLEANLADVGVGVGSVTRMAQRWEEMGHTVLHRSVSQPYFPLIALNKFTPAQIANIRKLLLDMAGNPADQAVLKTLGIEGFNADGEQRLQRLLDWLGDAQTAQATPAAAPGSAR